MPEHSCSLGVEARYMMDEAAFRELINGMHGKWVPDSYSYHTLCELYLDTGASAPTSDDTLRLRSYGIPSPDDCVYLERAMRVGGVSCTRRVALTLREAEACIRRESEGQALRAPDALLGQHATPRLLLAYERHVYGFAAQGTTITVDSALRYRTEALDLQQGDWGTRLLPEGSYLLKVTGDLPARLYAALGALQAQPTAFTNYGYAFIAANLKERRRCV